MRGREKVTIWSISQMAVRLDKLSVKLLSLLGISISGDIQAPMAVNLSRLPIQRLIVSVTKSGWDIRDKG